MSSPTVFPQKTNRHAERQAAVADRDSLIMAAMVAFPRDTVSQLAERFGLSVRGLYDRTSAPAFQQRLAELRATTLADAAALATAQAVEAVKTIQGVMTNADAADRDRLAASRLMIDAATKLQDAAFVGPTLAAIRAELAMLTVSAPIHGELPPAGEAAEQSPSSPAPPSVEIPTTTPEVIDPAVMERLQGIVGKFGASSG